MRIYNTRTRAKEDFESRLAGKVGIYACGPTVYNHIHIGNARTFLNFDMIRRYLAFAGYDVTFVQNITDVDDKIISQAKQEYGDELASGAMSPEEATQLVAQKYTDAFERAMSDLRMLPIEPPGAYAPRATEHIDGMIEMIALLIERGYAYEVGGDVYFEVRTFGDYGKLSGRSLDDMRAGERVVVDERKRDPMDFALWKSAKPGEPSWESPWGRGRPGWHIECSVMSAKYLGDSFDIHGGASDLIFPHHENEVAQSEAATGIRPFARIWMHAGLLNVNKEKMAKSLGNFTLLKDVLTQGYDANTIRMLMLGTHYRKPLDFSDSALDEARAKVERFANCFRDAEWAVRTADVSEPSEVSELARACDECETEFRAEMDDDFNTAGALGAIFELVAALNVLLKEKAGALPDADAADVRHAATVIEELAGVLGLKIRSNAKETAAHAGEQGRAALRLPDGSAIAPDEDSMSSLRDSATALGLTVEREEDLVLAVLDKRAEARAARDWAASDAIRDSLREAGLAVEDTPQGQRVTPILSSPRDLAHGSS